MSTNINQGQIISKLNLYLKANHLPLEMNKNGICNGLAALHAEYALQNKEDEFKKILEFIATGKRDEHITNEMIDVFAIKVAATFAPQRYTSNLGQTGAIQMLSINNQNLSSSFSYTMASSKKDWAEMLTTLNLKEDEALQVRSKTHVGSVIKRNGKYVVYDPNYAEGYKTFSSEKQLIDELHTNVFRSAEDLDPDQLGMTVHLIRHPEAKPRELPSKTELYNRYLPATNAKSKAFTLNEAALHSNEDETRLILGLTNADPLYAAGRAVVHNNQAAFKTLIEDINTADDRQIAMLLLLALKGGRKELFENLLDNERVQKCYFEQFMRIGSSGAVSLAAMGGNPELMTLCIEHVRQNQEKICETVMMAAVNAQNLTPEEADAAIEEIRKNRPELIQETLSKQFIAALGTKSDPVLKAIQSGSIETLNVLFDTLGKDASYPDAIKKEWLMEAIRSNQFLMVSHLIEEKPGFSHEELQTLSIPPLMVDQSNILTLRVLQKHDVPLPANSQSLISERETQPRTFLQSLGVFLRKFTDFFREHFCPRYDSQAFKQAVRPPVEVDGLTNAGTHSENITPDSPALR